MYGIGVAGPRHPERPGHCKRAESGGIGSHCPHVPDHYASTELERRVHSGEFEEANFAELLLELRTLLENLDLNTPTPFATDHATNRFLVAGTSLKIKKDGFSVGSDVKTVWYGITLILRHFPFIFFCHLFNLDIYFLTFLCIIEL